MKILKLGKLIEKNGFKIIVATFVVMFFVSGFIFYFFAWRSIDYAQNLGLDSITIKNDLLENFLKDLDDRSSKLSSLKQNSLYVSDIFK
jgi:hypothetical protein